MPRNSASVTDRIESIDIFRGLTVVVMVFVNDLSGATGLPWWTYHMPADANGMTYVDMVFPAFLFIVGMSIPLAIQRRLAKGCSLGRIWRHILVRSLSLVALGLFLANAEKVDPKWMGDRALLCTLLAFLGALVLWSAYPVSPKYKTFYRTLKYAGLLALVWFAISFRRGTPDGRGAWLDFSYWEILGLIGWAYLAVGTLYLFLKDHIRLLMASLVALSALNVLSTMGRFKWIGNATYASPFEPGLSFITMAGVVASLLLFETPPTATFKTRLLPTLGYAGILAIAGFALSPLGISKVRATPSWCLYCSAANILLFLLLRWVVDIKQRTKWAGFAKPAGENTLLAYMLPYLVYGLLYVLGALQSLSANGSYGWVGVLRATLFTSVVLVFCAILTQWKIRLQL
ncbi:MAG TPA: DUF5009 domain-containing protein [Vicinamibacteria bacterium]|nr:DUF5009 domain-containing protein [Vicinamibacteria bacterium]